MYVLNLVNGKNNNTNNIFTRSNHQNYKKWFLLENLSLFSSCSLCWSLILSSPLPLVLSLLFCPPHPLSLVLCPLPPPSFSLSVSPGLRCGLCSLSSLVSWPSLCRCWRLVSDSPAPIIRAFLWLRETSTFSLWGKVHRFTLERVSFKQSGQKCKI